MADRTTTDTKTKLRKNRPPRRTSQVDSIFEQSQEQIPEINQGDSEMSDQQGSAETGEEKKKTKPGIGIPGLGPTTFTAGGHRLPVPLRFETTMVHFDNYENDDKVPIEFLSTAGAGAEAGAGVEVTAGAGPGDSENRGHASSKAGRQECR